METIHELTSRYAREGVVDAIFLRPARLVPAAMVQSAEIAEPGLVGDHRNRPGKRAVTLLQAEHLQAIAAFMGRTEIAPALLRRNIIVAGINLLGLRDRDFMIGPVKLRGTGVCAPCSRMEDALGPGGYAAVRGHGGITAEVLRGGAIEIGSPVRPCR